LTKIPQTYSVSYFNLGKLELFLRGLSPPKPPPWRRDWIACGCIASL